MISMKKIMSGLIWVWGKLHEISRADSDEGVDGVVIGDCIDGGLDGEELAGAVNVHFDKTVAGRSDPLVTAVLGGGGGRGRGR